MYLEDHPPSWLWPIWLNTSRILRGQFRSSSIRKWFLNSYLGKLLISVRGIEKFSVIHTLIRVSKDSTERVHEVSYDRLPQWAIVGDLSIDFKKTFDTVKWRAITNSQPLGFSQLFTKIIGNCIFITSFFVPAEGTLIPPFKNQRGIWQDDSLSPILFDVITMV